MAKAKSQAEWTASYRRRMEAAYAKNPYASKTEARRGSNSKEARAERGSISEHEKKNYTAQTGLKWEGPENTQDRTAKNIKIKISNVNLREELGIISKSEAAGLRTTLKDLGKSIKNLDNLTVGSRAYHAAVEGIKATYEDLYMQGVIGDVDEDPFGDIFYH